MHTTIYLSSILTVYSVAWLICSSITSQSALAIRTEISFFAIQVMRNVASQVRKSFNIFYFINSFLSIEIFLPITLLLNTTGFILSVSIAVIHIAFPLHLTHSQFLLTFLHFFNHVYVVCKCQIPKYYSMNRDAFRFFVDFVHGWLFLDEWWRRVTIIGSPCLVSLLVLNSSSLSTHSYGRFCVFIQ